MSLTKCLKKHKDAFSKEEIAALKAAAKEYVTTDGMTPQEAGRQAVLDVLDELHKEANDIRAEVGLPAVAVDFSAGPMTFEEEKSIPLDGVVQKEQLEPTELTTGGEEMQRTDMGDFVKIETPNGQIFEVYKSRKAFAESLKWSVKGNGDTWEDEDGTVWLKMKDGSEVHISKGDRIPKFNMSNIVKGTSDNGSSVALYNVGIVKNEKYDDYDVDEEARIPRKQPDKTDPAPADKTEKDAFVAKGRKPEYYVEQLADLGMPEDLLALAKEIIASKPYTEEARSEDGKEQQITRWDGNALYVYQSGDWGHQRIQFDPSNGYVDFGHGEGTPTKEPAHAEQTGQRRAGPGGEAESAKAETPPAPQGIRPALEVYKPELEKRYKGMVESAFTNAVAILGPKLPGVYKHSRFASLFSDGGLLRGIAKKNEAGEYEIVQANLDRVATDYAENAITAWEAKMTAKMGELDDAEVSHLDGVRFAITGTKNGHKVRIEQDMILNTSSKGKPFNQFPARLYVDGKFTPESKFKTATA